MERVGTSGSLPTRPTSSKAARGRRLVIVQSLLFIEKLVVVPVFVFLALGATRGVPFLALWPALLVLAVVSLGAMALHGLLAFGFLRNAPWAWDTAWTGGWGVVILDGILAFALAGAFGQPAIALLLLLVVFLDAWTLWQVRDTEVARHHHRADPTRRF